MIINENGSATDWQSATADRVHNNPSPGDGDPDPRVLTPRVKTSKNIQMTHLIDHIPIIGYKIYFTR